jgi:hypothetical protein
MGLELLWKKWQISEPSALTFESNKLPYFTFYLKSQKPINAVIWHLPFTVPADDISDGLMNLGFDVVSVKQMSATH